MRKEVIAYVAKLEKANTKRELKSVGDKNGKKDSKEGAESKEKKENIHGLSLGSHKDTAASEAPGKRPASEK